MIDLKAIAEGAKMGVDSLLKIRKKNTSVGETQRKYRHLVVEK